MKNTLQITINPNPTDADLIEQIIKGAKYCHAGFDVRLVVAGYEDDPRELNEIPSAVETIQRWCRLGGLSSLSMMSPAGGPFNCPDGHIFGISADITWVLSNGFGIGCVVDNNAFLRTIEESNTYCDEHYTGEKHFSVLPSMLAGSAA